MTRLAILKRIDPHEHPIRLHQLRVNFIRTLVIVDGWLRLDAPRRQFLEDTVKPVVLGRRLAPRRLVTPLHDPDPAQSDPPPFEAMPALTTNPQTARMTAAPF